MKTQPTSEIEATKKDDQPKPLNSERVVTTDRPNALNKVDDISVHRYREKIRLAKQRLGLPQSE